MATHYFKKSLGILCDQGPVSLAYKSARHILRAVPRTGIPCYYHIQSYRNWKSSGNYDCRPNPFKIVWVNPASIEYNSKSRFSYLDSKYRDSGKIIGGDWDLSNERQGMTTIYDSDEPKKTIYKSFYLHFEKGYEWESTPFVQKAIKKIEDGEDPVWHGCSTKSEVLKRCVKMDRIFKNMEVTGYISKKDLINQNSPQLKNPRWFEQAYDEVVVNIGRNGELLFVGGHHRLAMAKILDIDKIPVRLFVRHKQWQQLRDEIHKNGIPEGREGLRDHPDIKGILKNN